jgi:phosphotriesterase-related protein
MPMIETVRGPVDVDELGPTLMHEHVFIMQPEMLANYGSVWGAPYWDEQERVADAVAKLARARDAGWQTILDPTVPGLGRDVSRLQRINQAVDLNIVVATGVYAFLELPGFLAYRADDVVTELFVREIRVGINDTGVKAGFLKCAVEAHGIVGDVPRTLAIVAAASVETGAPIMVHTSSPARMGLPVLEALTGHGVAPEQIVIAHAGDSNDLDYLRAIADSGAWLGCDRFGIDHFNPDADRVRTLVALLAEGYADRVHLGQDTACFYDFMVHNPYFADERPDLLHLSNAILPALREAGVTEEQIEQMTVVNPRRFLGGRDGAAAAPPPPR